MRRPFVRILIVCALWACATPLFFAWIFTSPSWSSGALLIGSAAGVGALFVIAGTKAMGARRGATQWVLYSILLFGLLAGIAACGVLVLCLGLQCNNVA